MLVSEKTLHKKGSLSVSTEGMCWTMDVRVSAVSYDE